MFKVNVTCKAEEAESICSFELCAVDGGTLPAFKAGAHIDIHIAAGLIRQYSLCNDPRERHRYLICVLKDPISRGGSRAMHEQIRPGQTLSISTPRNFFPLERSAKRHMLFAGGIGITPMLAMAYELSHQGTDFELHYCFRSSGRAAFVGMLAQTPFAGRVKFHDDSGAQIQKLDASAVLAVPDTGTHLYVCGPVGFINYILDAAQNAGWSRHCIHKEFFTTEPADLNTNVPFEVELASSGQIFQIPAERTVLEVLEEAGILIESSCEQGVCGTCVTRVLKGTPEHRDKFLTVAEQSTNNCFTPCCSRAKSLRLVLDL